MGDFEHENPPQFMGFEVVTDISDEAVAERADWLRSEARAMANWGATHEADLTKNAADMLTALSARVTTLEAALAKADTAVEAERATFPILGSNGARIDFQLVQDHGKQAQENHGQSVKRLAERGGLSWCELFAVLHNQKWRKIDQNEAMISCRGIEARYLAAIRARSADGGV